MQPLVIDGKTYTPLNRWRPADHADLRIYRSDESFVRIGPKATIEAYIRNHSRLESAGFPVPRILERGSLGSEQYFIEESLGDETFRIRFAHEVQATGSISSDSFRLFLEISKRYLLAQIQTKSERNEQEFLAMSHVEALCAEMPECAQKIRDKAAERLASLKRFPFVLSHGDFSPNNVFPNGIIDLEESHYAPFGYDAVCSITTADWYPETGEFEFDITPYHFSQEQRGAYFAMCDALSIDAGLPAVSEHLNDFDFFRAVWLTEGMGDWPKTQQYRQERFVRLYL